MKYLMILFMLVGCSCSFNGGKIHDYQITNAVKKCASNGGLHYIVEKNKVDYSLDKYRIYNKIIVHCQNNSVFEGRYEEGNYLLYEYQFRAGDSGK